jgi:Kef-type K+ transport system membrane component KefB
MWNDAASHILLKLHRAFQAFPQWLYDWQTLVGALVAGAAAIIAAIIAWKAVMKQITATQSERDRRERYAAALAISYLGGVREVMGKVEKQHKKLALVTDEQWRSEHQLAPSILRSAEAAFTEPNRRPRMGDVEQYREELPLFLSSDLRLVFRLENDLSAMIAELLGQQNIACTFPIQDCKERLRLALKKLDDAVNAAEVSFERYKYE